MVASTAWELFPVCGGGLPAFYGAMRLLEMARVIDPRASQVTRAPEVRETKRAAYEWTNLAAPCNPLSQHDLIGSRHPMCTKSAPTRCSAVVVFMNHENSLEALGDSSASPTPAGKAVQPQLMLLASPPNHAARTGSIRLY
eukprot:5209776-Amphidinium_carterae.1